jgi:Winged helix DNA-binding domain
MVERLVGMQAQVPSNPYVALWARLCDFDPAELSELIAGRGAVRAQLMRSTIHLVTARDALALHGLTAPVLARTFGGQAQFLRAMVAAGVDLEEVVAAGRELIAEAPRTRAELAAALGPRWPQVAPATLAQAVTFHSALVQVPPRGLWRESGAPRWALTEAWLGAAPEPEPSLDAVVLRYLAAFGPATASDVRTWSGFTGLRPVIDRLRPRLRSFRDEQGRELLDVPDAPRPDPETPAPPRFLPEYDNLGLSHADRARIFNGLGPGPPLPTGTWIGSLYADGFYRAWWKLTEQEGVATLAIDRFVPSGNDPLGTRDEIAAEGERLLRFIAPEATAQRVDFTEPRSA